jgi:TonB family protein
MNQHQSLRPAAIQSLGGISTLNAGMGGGGAAIALSGAEGFQAIAGDVLQMVNYHERSRMIREATYQGGNRNVMQKINQAIKTRPVPTYTPEPRYPDAAREKNIEGFIKLRLLIDKEGKVEKCEILMAQPENMFEECITNVLPRWQFDPATDRTGKPIESWIEFNYIFKMEDA